MRPRNNRPAAHHRARFETPSVLAEDPSKAPRARDTPRFESRFDEIGAEENAAAMSGLKAMFPRGEEGKGCRRLSGGNPPSPAKGSPRRTSPQSPASSIECKRSSRKCWQEEQRNEGQTHHRPNLTQKRSPRRYVLEQDFSQDEMGVLRAGSANNNINSGGVGGGLNEPFGEMSFLEFESLYTLEKELMQSRVDVGQAAVDEKQRVLGWAGGRRGLYTELPDPLCAPHQPPPSSLIPSEGFSFAPGWSLSVDHFYQWQRRGRATHQVSTRKKERKNAVMVDILFWE